MSYAPVNRISVGDLPALGAAPLNTIIHGDCFAALPFVATGSIDAIICDLPYGVTNSRWDSVLPMNDFVVEDGKTFTEQEFMLRYWQLGYSPKGAKKQWLAQKQPGLWSHYERVLKPSGVVVLTASQPFTAALVMSNRKWFKHEWVWIKNRGSNFANTVREPFKEHESVLVFSRGGWAYNPQRQERTGGGKALIGAIQRTPRKMGDSYGKCETRTGAPMSELRLPSSWQKFNTDTTGVHPTVKPTPLWEYLIKTYTHEGHTILDNCGGSMTTAVACDNLNRNWLCIEQDAGYCEIGEKRINANRERLTQLQPQ